MRTRGAVVAVACALAAASACRRSTGELAPEQRARAEREGIVREAVDLDFRYSHDLGTERQGWEDRRASILVTKESLLVHDRDRELLLVTARSTGAYEVHRDKDRVAIRAGSGRSGRSWSFRPPDDPEGWTADIRAVVRRAAGRGDP